LESFSPTLSIASGFSRKGNIGYQAKAGWTFFKFFKYPSFTGIVLALFSEDVQKVDFVISNYRFVPQLRAE
jgi:hypothetical protein